MSGYLIRLAILLAVIFGVVYGVTRAVGRRRDRQRGETARQARERIAALQQALERREISAAEYDQLVRPIYDQCRAQGVDLDVES